MKRVFISHPVRGNVQANVKNASRWVRLALLEGHIPIAPYIAYTQALDDSIETERMTGHRAGLELLLLCNELWVCGEHISEGMEAEIWRCYTYNIPVRYRASSEIESVVLPV